MHLFAANYLKANPGAQFAIAQVSGTIERSFTNADWSAATRFREARDFRPDVIIAFFGANVPRTYDENPSASARTFGAAVGETLDFIDQDGRAQVVISEGYYIRPALDAEKRALAERRGATWVEIDDIRRRADTHGLHNHPNDLGMTMIAQRFQSAVLQGKTNRK